MKITWRVVREWHSEEWRYYIRRVHESPTGYAPVLGDVGQLSVDQLREELHAMLAATEKPVLEYKPRKLVEIKK